MNDLSQTLGMTLAGTLATMVLLWLVATARHDVSIVDLFWGAGFAIVTWTALGLNSPASNRVWLLVVLTTLWGARLSLYLLYRNWGRGEDRRYSAMRARHGQRFVWVSLATVFLLQGAILWFVSLPLQVATVQSWPTTLGWLDGIGIIVWAVGIGCESIADWQLLRFKADPRNAGHVLDRGLWRFTRHPNYFGDFCVWWGLYLIAAAGGAVWTVASPMLMSLLLLKISGVTLLERTIIDRRPDYDDYQSRTNAFFPGPPRKPAPRSER